MEWWLSLHEVITMTRQECPYCGGNCPRDPDHACDGFLGDIDNLWEETKDAD